MSRIRDHLYKELSKEERDRIEKFMAFAKVTIVPSTQPGTFEELIEVMNSAIRSAREGRSNENLYLLKVKGRPEAKHELWTRDLSIAMLLNLLQASTRAALYFDEDHLIVEAF